MNSFGKILVHLDDSLDGDSRIKLARQVAHIRVRLGEAPSKIEAVYATTPSYFATYMGYSEYTASALALLMEADEKRCEQAKARFDKWVQPLDSDITWASNITDLPGSALLNHAWLADLLVLAQNNPSDAGMNMVPRSLLENLIIDSGKPGLILPYIGTMKSSLQRVMIAWKPTRESSRALTAALPFLLNSTSIDVVSDTPVAEMDNFKWRFESYLRANGVSVVPSFHSSMATESKGEGLLSIASDLTADLLVMGCYGHSRSREFVLGGASRTILKSMTLPVLMAH